MQKSLNSKQFWNEWWKRTDNEEDWIDTPSIFAQFAVSYFPARGKILELGAGLGKDARYFASHNYKVVATDFSDEALRISHYETLNQKLSVEYTHLDLKEMFPFEKESFDVVFAHSVLHYFNHKTTDQIFREIHRVLTTKGVFATLLKSKEDPEVLLSKKLNENFYRTPNGLIERFFSVDELIVEIKGLFEPLVLDSSEQTHETDNATFIRFIGSKIATV